MRRSVLTTESLTMKWIKANSYEEMSQVGAQIFVEQLQLKPDSVLGFATGGTPKGLYKKLVHAFETGEVSFEAATGFNLDEYIGLTPEHHKSYHYYMKQNLYQYINMPKENIHLPKGDAANLEEAAAHYDLEIEQAGGIDIQLLGIGVNGHIGFNEPGASIDVGTSIVKLADSTIEANKIYFNSIDEVPKEAITMGIGSILKAKKIVLLMSGASKQEAFDRLRSGEITEEFPASALHKHHDVTVIYAGVK